MFCPFAQGECREDCVFYSKGIFSQKYGCAILRASVDLESINERLGSIESDTSFIPDLADDADET